MEEKNLAEKKSVTLYTERLILTPWTDSWEDAEGLFRYAKNPNVGPNAGWAPHKSVEESLKIIRELFLCEIDNWSIRHKDNNIIIGHISLFQDTIREKVNSMEIGYNLDEAEWGKGYMTEAVKAVIDYGFKTHELDVIAIRTSPTNTRSARVIEKCGFTYEGTLRKVYKIYDGSLRDSRIFSLLREEWESQT